MSIDRVPVDYPDDDEVPYLEYFSKEYSEVFVALNPFFQVPGYQREFAEKTEWIPEEVEIAVRQAGLACGVSWREVAMICGFPSVRHVNRALRSTGSARITAEFANPDETRTLLRFSREREIILPDEGYFSPVLEMQTGLFLAALGHEKVLEFPHFLPTQPSEIDVSDLVDQERVLPRSLSNIYAMDGSVFMTMYTDYHHVLVCQTGKSKSSVDPSAYFEGFQAGPATSDMWGVGNLD